MFPRNPERPLPPSSLGASFGSHTKLTLERGGDGCAHEQPDNEASELINNIAELLKNVPLRVWIQPSGVTAHILAVLFSKTVLKIDGEFPFYFAEF